MLCWFIEMYFNVIWLDYLFHISYWCGHCCSTTHWIAYLQQVFISHLQSISLCTFQFNIITNQCIVSSVSIILHLQFLHYWILSELQFFITPVFFKVRVVCAMYTGSLYHLNICCAFEVRGCYVLYSIVLLASFFVFRDLCLYRGM